MPKTRAILFLLVALAISSGAADALQSSSVQPGATPLDILWTIAFGATSFAWYYFDARQRGFKRSKILDIFIISLSILGIPFYLARSRVRGERLKAFGLFVAFVVALFALTVATTWLVQHARAL